MFSETTKHDTGAAVSFQVLFFFFFFKRARFNLAEPQQLRYILVGGVSTPENSNRFICYILAEFRFCMMKLLFPALSISPSAFYIFG